jgi:hypothetical protein
MPTIVVTNVVKKVISSGAALNTSVDTAGKLACIIVPKTVLSLVAPLAYTPNISTTLAVQRRNPYVLEEARPNHHHHHRRRNAPLADAMATCIGTVNATNAPTITNTALDTRALNAPANGMNPTTKENMEKYGSETTETGTCQENVRRMENTKIFKALKGR